jgi:hypothetical protein
LTTDKEVRKVVDTPWLAKIVSIKKKGVKVQWFWTVCRSWRSAKMRKGGWDMEGKGPQRDDEQRGEGRTRDQGSEDGEGRGRGMGRREGEEGLGTGDKERETREQGQGTRGKGRGTRTRDEA